MGRTVCSFVVVLASCGRLDFQSRVVDDAPIDVPIDVACGAVDDQMVACPGFDTGMITNERVYDCTVGAWGAWAVTDNTCQCVPGTQTQTLTCPVGQIGQMIETRTWSCPTMTWSMWTIDTDTCA